MPDNVATPSYHVLESKDSQTWVKHSFATEDSAVHYVAAIMAEGIPDDALILIARYRSDASIEQIFAGLLSPVDR